MMDVNDAPLVIRRLYRHEVRRVFSAFSSAEAVKQWFAPDDSIETIVTQYDFYQGGSYRMEFGLPGGLSTSLTGTFQAIEAPAQLVFSFRWEKPDPHAGIETIVSVDFVAKGEHTEIIVSHTKLSDAPMRSRHAEGWQGTLQRLETYLKELTKELI